MRLIVVVAAFLAGLLLLTACAPRTAPEVAPSAPQVAPPAAPQATPAALIRPVWEQEWEKTVRAAQKEGRLIIYTPLGAEARTAFGLAFRQKYDISPEFMAGRTADTFPRLEAERRAELFLADVYIGGSSPVFNVLKPQGAVDTMEPLLV